MLRDTFADQQERSIGLCKGIVFTFIVLCVVLTIAACSSASSKFTIEGKWKNTGAGEFGQMQQGAIITFNGSSCNVYSPSDSYAFYEENGTYHLDVTGLLGGTPSFTVNIIDNDHIELVESSTTVELTRVG